MQVIIDSSRCSGHGRCYSLAPTVFTPDDEGFPRQIGEYRVVAEEDRAAVDEAVANCPERAVATRE